MTGPHLERIKHIGIANLTNKKLFLNHPRIYVLASEFHFPSVLIFNEAGSSLEIGSNHLFDQRIKVNATFPPQTAFSFGRITKEEAKQIIMRRKRVEEHLNTHSTSAGRK